MVRASGGPNVNAPQMRSAPGTRATCSTNTELTVRTRHEVARGETFDRCRGSQDKRESRRSILERHEGDLRSPKHDLVGARRGNRQQPPAGKPFLADPAIRARLLQIPRPDFPPGAGVAGRLPGPTKSARALPQRRGASA